MSVTDDTGRTDSPESISRRRVLTGAGAAVAGAAALGAAGVDVAVAADGSRVAVSHVGTVAVEFRARIEQSAGEAFVSYGYLTRVAGLAAKDLFAGTPSDATALFTAYATGRLVARTSDQSVHALDIKGTLDVYQRRTAGATFGSPDSFRQGRRVATYDLRLQDVLTVFAPAKGLPTLVGDMRQTSDRKLAEPHSDQRFGSDGRRLRLDATGIGTLTNPVALDALLEIAGGWTSV
jgi:hypothetical protein